MTVTSVNVLSENVQHDRVIADLIEANPDVIAVLELTPMLDQKLRQDLPADSHVMSRAETVGILVLVSTRSIRWQMQSMQMQSILSPLKRSTLSR